MSKHGQNKQQGQGKPDPEPTERPRADRVFVVCTRYVEEFPKLVKYVVREDSKAHTRQEMELLQLTEDSALRGAFYLENPEGEGRVIYLSEPVYAADYWTENMDGGDLRRAPFLEEFGKTLLPFKGLFGGCSIKHNSSGKIGIAYG